MNRLAVEFETLKVHGAQSGANLASGFIAASRSFSSLCRPARLGILIILALLINAMAPVPDQSNRNSASLLPLEPAGASASVLPPQNGGGNGAASKIAMPARISGLEICRPPRNAVGPCTSTRCGSHKVMRAPMRTSLSVKKKRLSYIQS